MSATTLIFNPRSPEFHANPYPTYTRLQDSDPIHVHPMGFVLLTRYEDCMAALRDNRFGRGGFEAVFMSEYEGLDDSSRLPRSMLFSDPPDHTRLRSLVNKAFTSRVVDAMRTGIQQIVDGLLERQPQAGPVNVVETLAYPLPVTVVCQLLGLPVDDHPKMREWSAGIARVLDAFAQTEDAVAQARHSRRKLVEYFRAVISERRQALGEDLLSSMIAVEDGGERLSMGELIATCVLLFVAGHETTVNLIGNTLLCLLQHPAQLERLRADPTLLAGAVEETLRFESPVQRTPRLLVEDVEFKGRTLKKRSMVVVALGAANRDPAQFADAQTFDITRKDNRHLAFGFGIHFCIGLHLARMEAQIAVGTFLAKYPKLRLLDYQWRESSTLRGLKSMHVEIG